MSKQASRATVEYKRPETQAAQPGPVFLPPFRPRPRLFYALLVVLAVWVVVLLVLYFATVYPNRGREGGDSAAVARSAVAR